MSSKLCRYVLCPIFLTVCYFLEGKHGGMCSPLRGGHPLITPSKLCLSVLLSKNTNDSQRKNAPKSTPKNKENAPFYGSKNWKNAPDINFYTRNKSRKIMSETMMPRWVRRVTPFSIATSSLSTKRANTFSA